MYDDFEYEIMQMPEKYSAIEIITGSPLNMSANVITVPVVVTLEKSKRSSCIKLRLHLYKNVLTAKNKIESRSLLNAADFELKKIDVSFVKGTPVSSLDEVNRFKTKVAITPGRILVREILEPKPVILNGDLVKASLSNGNVTVSLEANARQDGAVGEIIRVVTPDKKQYRAKVVDSSNVNILE